jgi:hypothetical protein
MDSNQEKNELQDKSYEWIVNAIASSNNPFHIDCCKKLIELFVQKFPNSNFKEAELLMLLYSKNDTINYI